MADGISTPYSASHTTGHVQAHRVSDAGLIIELARPHMLAVPVRDHTTRVEAESDQARAQDSTYVPSPPVLVPHDPSPSHVTVLPGVRRCAHDIALLSSPFLPLLFLSGSAWLLSSPVFTEVWQIW